MARNLPDAKWSPKLALTAVLMLMFCTTASTCEAAVITSAARALGWTVNRTSSFVATYAAAHSLAGTGGPGLSPGWCVNGSLTGQAVFCNSSDFFGHQTPPGNDSALASASAFSRLLGLDTTAQTHTTTAKGDFALAAAFAKGGTSLSTSGSLKFNVGLSLGRLTLTAALDPGIATYSLALSDLDPSYLNENVMNTFMKDQFIANGLGASVAKPANTFYSLNIDYNADTGVFNVLNSSNYLASGSLLTNNDFEVGYFDDTDLNGNPISRPGIRLKDEARGNFVLELDGNNIDTLVSLDSQQFEVAAAAVPEPASVMILTVASPLLLAASTKKFRRKIVRKR